MLKKRYFAD